MKTVGVRDQARSERVYGRGIQEMIHMGRA